MKAARGEEDPQEYRVEGRRAHFIVYQLVWCPRRRRPVLQGQVAARLQELLTQACASHGWEALEIQIQPDYVHLRARVTPLQSADAVVRACKAATAAPLRREFAHLRRLPSMWTRSYLASTAPEVSERTIQRYIEAQTAR